MGTRYIGGPFSLSNGGLSSSAKVKTPNTIREIYASQHIGTIALQSKTLTEFERYTISESDALIWMNNKKLIEDRFMLGVNWANSDNTIRFVCTWNGVTMVDSQYVRPGITGAPAFASNQNRVLDFLNETRVQAISGNLASPRTHIKWRTNYGGTIDFGSLEEHLYGQSQVDLSGGVTVVWSYQLYGTGAPTLYHDHLRVTM